MSLSPVRIGLAGFGNVGAGVWKNLEGNRQLIEGRSGVQMEITRVAVRDLQKPRSVEIPADRVTTDWRELVAADDVDVVVELIGGIAILVGWKTAIWAVLLGGFSVISGLLFHFIPGLGMEGQMAQLQQIMFMKNLAIAGGMAMLFHAGPGAYALDNR